MKGAASSRSRCCNRTSAIVHQTVTEGKKKEGEMPASGTPSGYLGYKEGSSTGSRRHTK
jgi:hypothetical protein